ncbi:hemagglutinin repeat-containing protein, partial [Halomonas sp. DP4Y7-1]
LGRLTSQGDMTLSAASLDNQGTLGSLGDLRLDSASITNASDTLLFAGGDMTLHTQQLFNRYGDIYSRGDLTLTRNSALAKADRLENRSGTIEAEGDMTVAVSNVTNTVDAFSTEQQLVGREVSGTQYEVRMYRKTVDHDGHDGSGATETITLLGTIDHFGEYQLVERFENSVSLESAAAEIVAGGNVTLLTDELVNDASIIAANGDVEIRTDTLENTGRSNTLVEKTTVLATDEDALACTKRENFNRCMGYNGSGGRFYRLFIDESNSRFDSWNTTSGFDSGNTLLPLPFLTDEVVKVSEVETRTILPGGAPAVISAGGRVSITATEQLHNGDIQEHTLAQLQGRLGDAATQGPVSTLSMTLGRDADQASAQGLNAPSRVDRSGASRDASLADIGATPNTAGGGLDGALDTSVGAGFDAGGGVWVFDDAPFLRVDIAQTPSFRLPEGDYGLFVRAPEAQGRYLVETNPEFTNLEQWRGSDYLLDKLGYTDDEAYRLLGDGRYESRLIRQAVLATTGQRYLSEGLGDDYAQYRYLMNNALASKDRLSLSVGVGLSPEQVAALTHDIVWLEERQIDGQTVLAPVLYLANLDSRDVRGGGVIQGRDIDLISGGDLVNVGTLRATHDLNAYAAGSVLQGGLVKAGDALNLTARDDIRNAMGGQIRGDRVSLTALEGDVVNDRLSVAAGTSRDYRSYLDQGGSISARDQLDIQAGRDVVNRGSVTSGADLSVTAGRDIVAGAVVDVSHWQDARGRDYQDSRTTLGSTTTAGGDLTWQAGRDIAIDASQVLSGDDLVLAAGRDMAIVSGEDSDASRDVSRRQITTTDSMTQVGSALEAGGSASLSAGGDIGLLASRVEAGEGLGLVAGGDITLASAANSSESHTRKPNKTYDTRTVRQQGSELAAGTDLTVAAGGDLTLVASTASAGDEAYLYAGGDVALLAANDEDYSRYEKNESGGLFGGDKHRLDEVQDLRAQGSQIESGGDLIIVSDGDQTYEGARLDAGNDLVLDSGGEITFAHARDLHSETHEKSSSNAVWQSAKGEGETVETLRQSELVAQGERIIRAAQGVNVDIEQVDEQSIHQTITAMVEADPSLAWLAEMEARGDVDWREVKALHDQWDYDHSGMSAAAQLVVAIVVAYYVGPMATKLVAGGASTGALAAGGWANVAAATSLTSVASNTAVSTINQQGDLGEAWGDVTSSDALRGYAVAGMTAGLTNGLYDGWTGTQTGLTTGLPNSGTVTGAPLGTWQGAGQFGANQLLQNTTSALLDRALGGDAALGDAFQASLANTFAAVGFNAIGNTSLENGSLNKAALHAVMGGLAAEAAGGDFTTGALAAGANELLVDKLAGEYSDLDQADKGRLLVMNSQIIGVIAAEIASNDDSELQIGAQVAGSATQYNYLSHWQKEQRSQELEACQSLSCKAERNEYWTKVNQLQDSAYLSGMASGVPQALYESASDLLALFDGDTYAAMLALLQEDNIIATLGEAVVQEYAERFETYHREYERAGADGAYNAGMEMGKAAVEVLSLAGAVAVKAAMTTGKIGRLATTAANSTRVDLPAGSIELRPVGAQHTTPPGYKVFQSPEGDRYYVSPEGQTYASLDDVPGGGVPNRTVVVEDGKFDYIFGRVTSNPHNTARSRQLRSELSHIGIHDTAEGRRILIDHFNDVASDSSSVVRTFSETHNGVSQKFTVRGSLLSGPGGFARLETTFETMPDGTSRFITTIPYR